MPLVIMAFAMLQVTWSQHLVPCASDQIRNARIAGNPNILVEEQKILQAWVNTKAQKRATGESAFQRGSSTDGYVIPVVVHLVRLPGDPTDQFADVSTLQVLSAIESLNDIFSTPWAYQGQPGIPAEGMDIEFCLARKDADGNATTGILQHENAHAVHQVNNGPAVAELMGLGNFPRDYYLNIFVVKAIESADGNVAGYAQFPNGAYSPLTDCIVIQYDTFGSVGYPGDEDFALLSNYNEGKVLAHEVGHWLGLRHTFHGGCGNPNSDSCETQGDQMCDTPTIGVKNIGCPTGNDSCPGGLPDQVENYMDYTDDACRTTFTSDQRDRMHMTLDTLRHGLCSDANIIATEIDCVPVPETAWFDFGPTQICPGDSIDAAAIYPGNIGVTFAWTLNGSAVGTSSPTLNLNLPTAGVFDLALSITANGISFSHTKQLVVANCNANLANGTSWFWGDGFGLEFNTDGTVALDTSAFDANTHNAEEGTIHAFDGGGNLLFYGASTTLESTTLKLWDSTHEPFTFAGTSTEATITGNPTAAQLGIAVPWSNNPNRFTIFTLGESMNPFTLHSDVEVLADGGVVHSANNVPPTDLGIEYLGREAVTAIPHCDGVSHWVIMLAKDSINSQDHLVSYRVANGQVTFGHALNTDPLFGLGISLTPSRDGDRIACGNYLFTFSRETGEITLESQLVSMEIGASTAFSPDGSLLYVSMFALGLVQFDLTGSFPYPHTVVAEIPNGSNGWSMNTMPDGRILVLEHSEDRLLGVINFPNERNSPLEANACGYQPDLLDWQGVHASRVRTGMPNFIPDFIEFPTPAIDFVSSFWGTICDTFLFSPSDSCQMIMWDFGDGTTLSASGPVTHDFDPGTYTVTATIGGQQVSQIINAGNETGNIVGPTLICDPVQYYSVDQPNMLVEWSVTGGQLGQEIDGEIQVIWTAANGQLTATVENPANTQDCSYELTLTVQNQSIPTPVISGDTLVDCDNTYTYTNLTDDDSVFGDWSVIGGTVINEIDHSVTVQWDDEPGSVSVLVVDMNGGDCTATDELAVQAGPNCGPIGIPGIEVNKIQINLFPVLDETLVYVITVNNVGEVAFTDCAIQEIYPTGFSVIESSIEAESGSPAGTDLFFTGPIEPGGQAVLILTGVITDPSLCSVSLSNVVEVVASDSLSGITVTESASAGTWLYCTDEPPPPCGAHSASASVPWATWSQTFEYNLCLTNCGSTTLETALLIFALPQGVDLVGTSSEPDGNLYNLYWWEFENVAPGEVICAEALVRLQYCMGCGEAVFQSIGAWPGTDGFELVPAVVNVDIVCGYDNPSPCRMANPNAGDASTTQNGDRNGSRTLAEKSAVKGDRTLANGLENTKRIDYAQLEYQLAYIIDTTHKGEKHYASFKRAFPDFSLNTSVQSSPDWIYTYGPRPIALQADLHPGNEMIDYDNINWGPKAVPLNRMTP